MRKRIIASLAFGIILFSASAFAMGDLPENENAPKPTKSTHNYNKPVPHPPGVFVPAKPGEPDNTFEPDNTVGVGMPYPRPSIGSMGSHGGGGGGGR